MEIWQVFLDESGHPNDANTEIFSVAGFMARESDWADFTKEWNLALSKEDVRLLHMREFAHSTGQFSDWKGDEARRQRFLLSLLSLIEDFRPQTLASALVMAAYRDLSGPAKARLGNPYFVLVQYCIVESATRLVNLPPQEKVAYYVERQDEFAFHARELFRKLTDPGYPLRCRERLDGLLFAEKASFAGLQAADLVAYESAKFLRYKLGYDSRQRGIRFPPRHILRSSFTGGGLFDRKGLEVLLRECGIADPWTK